MKTSSRIRNLRREIVNIYNLPEEVQEKFIIIAEHVEELEDQVKNHGVSHHIISTLQPCPTVCHGNVINGTCNVCGAKR